MNKIILTGHTHGLGAGMVQPLLDQGAQVLALSRSTSSELANFDTKHFSEVALDLSDTAAVVAWLATGALTDFLKEASTAILINNAGQVQPIGPPGVQGALQIATAVTLNITAPLILTDAFVAASEHIGDRRVLHISSGAARNAYAGWSVYCATKAALDHHARGVEADHLAKLRIESLAPGVIDTQMQAAIRATDAARFPAVERFAQMKREGGLASAQISAAAIVGHLFSDDFGRQIDTDIRQL